MRKPLTALRAPITLPDDSPVSGLWGAIWLNTALASVLKAVVHWNVLRLLAYGFLEVTLGLVLRAVASRPWLHQEIEALRRPHRYCPPRPRGQKDDVTVRAQTRWLWPRARREGNPAP